MKLHQVHLPDNGKADGKTDVSKLKCIHCGKFLKQGEAFVGDTVDPLYNSDGYFNRKGFEICTEKDNG
jgi:hypothetical protein